MAEMTFNPDTDGQLRRTAVDETWSTIRSSAGTAYVKPASTGNFAVLQDSATTSQYQALYRGIFIFDTSALSGLGTIYITGATLELRGNSKTDEIGLSGELDLAIFSASPTTPGALEAADYSNIGTTPYSSAISYGDWNTSDWNIFTLNSLGIAAISKTSYTNFGIKFNYNDAGNHDPSVWSGSGDYSAMSGVWCGSATNKPILRVQYSDSPVGTFNGLAKASVETINGLAIASVKSWNGLEL